jgi:hypothetical protein
MAVSAAKCMCKCMYMLLIMQDGESALHGAAMWSEAELQSLLSNGASVDARDKVGLYTAST